MVAFSITDHGQGRKNYTLTVANRYLSIYLVVAAAFSRQESKRAMPNVTTFQTYIRVRSDLSIWRSLQFFGQILGRGGGTCCNRRYLY